MCVHCMEHLCGHRRGPVVIYFIRIMEAQNCLANLQHYVVTDVVPCIKHSPTLQHMYSYIHVEVISEKRE